jgi:hypothetical protein
MARASRSLRVATKSLRAATGAAIAAAGRGVNQPEIAIPST